MIGFSRHLGFRQLERLVAERATPSQRRRALRHLESCGDCRARMQWLRSLPTMLEQATRLPLPEHAEARIHASREAGERVILPVREQRRRYARGRRVPLAAAITLVASGALAVALLRGIDRPSVRGQLAFEPDGPAPGEAVQVRYRPAAALADDAWLVLRGSTVPAPGPDMQPPRPRQLATLLPAEGSFTGTFALGDDTVYAELVVEDSTGRNVDDNNGSPWRILVHLAGSPSRDALRAQALVAGTWAARLDALRRATEAFPEDAGLHAARLTRELQYFVAAERDSALRVHRARYSALARAVTDPALTPRETLAGLASYAFVLGDSAGAALWSQSLRQGEARAADVDPLLALVDTAQTPPVWAAGGWNPVPVPQQGGGIVNLRAAVGRYAGGEVDRPLGATTGEHAQRVELQMRPLLVSLARSLLTSGQPLAALDTLRIAASIGWSTDVYAELAELQLALGDTLAAATSLARAAVVPFDAPDRGLNPVAGTQLVAPEQWEILIRAARDSLHRRTLDMSIDRPLPATLQLEDARGEQHELDALRYRTAAIVAFWDPRNGPAVRDLPELRRVAYLVQALGGEIVVITRARPSQRLDALLAEVQVRLPLYYDPGGEVHAAFGVDKVPEYHVLGLGGRIRFADRPLRETLALVDALLDEPRLTAGSAR